MVIESQRSGIFEGIEFLVLRRQARLRGVVVCFGHLSSDMRVPLGDITEPFAAT
jgi:hypothetical protein